MDIVTYALSKKYADSVASGKADLVNGKIPAEELPSYVDDVVEYSTISEFPAEGESGKIYVALDTGLTYRWSGSTYIQVGGSQTYQPFPAGWVTDVNHTTLDFCDSIDNDSSATTGMAYLGELRCSDVPTGLNTNIDTIVEIFNDGGNLGKVIHLICSSGDVYPYRWEYTYWHNGSDVSGWIGFEPKFTDGSATIATVDNNNVVTLKAGVKQSSGSIDNVSGNDIVLAKIAKTGSLADATDDANHRLVTDTQTTAWDGKVSDVCIDGVSVVVGGIAKFTNASAAQSGTTDSLVSTGEKYIWNNKQDALTFSTGLNNSSNTVKVVGVEYKDNTTVQSNPLKFVKMTQAQYDLITPDADTFYIIVPAQV